MIYVILSTVFGIVIVILTVFVPRILASRYNRPYDDRDSRAYLKQTGRSPQDIVHSSGNGQSPRPADEAGARRQDGTGSAGTRTWLKVPLSLC